MESGGFSSEKVREVRFASGGSDLIAACETHGRVSVVSLSREAVIFTKQTCYEFGGSRACILNDGDLQLLITACFSGNVEAYDLRSGRLAWTCRAGDKLQRVNAYPRSWRRHEAELSIHLDSGAARGVDAKDGALTWSRDTCRVLCESTRAAGRAAKIVQCHREWVYCFELDGSLAWSDELGKSVMSASMGRDRVAFALSGGPLLIRPFEGERRYYRWDPPANCHALHPTWNEALGVFVAVVWNYQNGSEKYIAWFDQQGAQVNRLDGLGELPQGRCDISGDGGLIVATSGHVLSARDGAVVWDFAGL